MWKKLHEPVWFNPLLRAQGEAARCLLGDLILLCDEQGSLPLPSKDALSSMCTDPLALDKLVAIEAVRVVDGRVHVACVVKDCAFSESRKAGGEARKTALKARKNDRATIMQPSCNHDAGGSWNHNPASASASASTSASDSDSRRESAEREPAATRLVSDFWCSKFLKIRGAKYVWQGGKDGALLARLLKATGGDVAEIQRRIERFLTDPFWSAKADFAKFAGQFNAMAGNGKPVDPFQQAAADLGVEWSR